MGRGEVNSGNEPSPPVRNCSRCGQPVSLGEFLQFDHQFICPQCKALYLQQLREGVSTEPEALRYAGFWIRGGALIIDGLLLWCMEALVWVAAGDTWSEAFGFDKPNPTVDKWSSRDWLVFTIREMTQLAYFAGMVARYGGTLGKLALRLRVVNANGQLITWKKAISRHFAVYLSLLGFVVVLPDDLMLYLLPCLLGLVMAAFDSQKRALHDRLCGTRVIRRSRTHGAGSATSSLAS